MPRALRILFSGAYYHVYNRGVEKRSIFLNNRDYKTFLQLLGETVTASQLNLFAYCLMGNHFHLFLQTTLPNLDSAMQNLQGQYAHSFNTRRQRVGSLFQDRYKSRLVNEDQYALALVRYIHQNPLKAKLTTEPENYPWSSYPSYVGKHPKWKWLNTSWILSQFHSDSRKARRLFEEFERMKPPIFEQEKIENLRCRLARTNPKGV